MIGVSEMGVEDAGVRAVVCILFQSTALMAAALGLSKFFRHDPAARECLLLPALLGLILGPLATVAMMQMGVTLIAIPTSSLTHETTSTTAPRVAYTSLDSEDLAKGEYSVPGDVETSIDTNRDTFSATVGSTTIETSRRWSAVAEESETSLPGRLGSALRTVLQAWFPCVLVVWGAGVLICLSLLLRSWLKVRRFLATTRPVQSEFVEHVYLSIREPLRRAVMPRIVESSLADYPLVAGILRPAIVLPCRLEQSLTSAELESVLLHELAHVVRRDQLVLLIQRLVSALLWFHPLVYWLNRELICAREEVCDNYALRSADTWRYGQTLLQIARASSTKRPGLLAPLGLFLGEWKLEERVSGLLDRRRKTVTNRRPWMAAAMALMTAALLIAGGTSWGAPSEDPGANQASPAITAGAEAVVVASAQPGSSEARPGGVQAHATGKDELQRIRARIYLLRHYRVFERTDVWAGAIKDLVEMGERALPELIRELDETDRDVTLRALGFTLRAIGDSRAVPALIRAIPKTLRPPGSDCGISVSDPDLHAFMKKHQRYQSDRDTDTITYGRPVNEILDALEKLTVHEYPTTDRDPLRHVFLARVPEKADPAKEDAKRQRFADRMVYWQSWWAEHGRELATDEEVKSVELPLRRGDPVTEAGIAEFGPMFPTGPDVWLSPIREVVLESSAFYNAQSNIDFDTGRGFEIFQGIDSVSDEQIRRVRFRIVAWQRAMEIDAHCRGAIEGEDLHIWRIENARWETIENEVARPGPLPLGPVVLTGLTPREGEPPATYLFTTREGGAGILQLEVRVPGTTQCRLRYRMILNAASSDSTDSPAANISKGSTEFKLGGSVTVHANEKPLLDLDSRKKYSLPDGLVLQNGSLTRTYEKDTGFAAWCAENGLDLAAQTKTTMGGGFMAGGNPSPYLIPPATKVRLYGLDMVAIRVLPRSFQELTVERVEELTSRADPMVPTPSLNPSLSILERPDTFAIRTRDGRLGVLQLSDAEDDVDSIVIRYRLQN